MEERSYDIEGAEGEDSKRRTECIVEETEIRRLYQVIDIFIALCTVYREVNFQVVA